MDLRGTARDLAVRRVHHPATHRRRARMEPGDEPRDRRAPMRTTSLRSIAALVSFVALAACSSKGGDPARQYGTDPYLPEPHEYLLPPMSVPKAIGWKAGEMPTVSAGLKAEVLATGLEHPRTLYTLPNGDILVVESNSPGTEPYRPKDFIAGKVKGRAGAAAKGGNPITFYGSAEANGNRA